MMENISDNEQQPFWYFVQCDGESQSFGYIEQGGTIVCSTIALVLNENGQWEEPYVGPERFTESPPVVTKVGENGSQVVIVTNFMADGNYLLKLVFETEVDFTQPLPIDKFSIKDSLLSIYIAGNIQNFAVQSIKPTTPPTAVSDTEKPADQN